MFIHQLQNWTDFYWDKTLINQVLLDVRYKQGFLLGKMNELGFDIQQETSLKMISLNILKSSEIEGENLNLSDVRSSVAKRLGLNRFVTNNNPDIETQGIVNMMLDATQKYNKSITEQRFYAWHKMLFPEKVSGLHKILVGQWRTEDCGDMKVVSGRIGKEKIHFQAPHANIISEEMNQLILWMNNQQSSNALISSAIAHFWFVTIHPFEDGNGRIARALSDLFLARSEQSEQRFYSMSNQISNDRKNYYNILEKSQRGDSDISEWLLWFFKSLITAIDDADKICDESLKKSKFWKYNSSISFSDRQRKVINKLFDGFEGKLTTTKWAKVCKCSQDTAYRDILDLIDKKIMQKSDSKGRSTDYTLIFREREI